MEKVQYSITINAPKEKVWNTILDDSTYRQWTSIFNPEGSYFEGDWSEGSEMRFLGPNSNGTVSGMVGRVEKNSPYDFISIRHLGEIINDQVQIWPDDKSIHSHENYTLKETPEGSTQVLVDLEISDEFKEIFNDIWPKALQKLKEVCENQTP